MSPHRGERNGFALAVAIAIVVVIGAMISGAFFASTQEHAIGRDMLLQTRALTAAEHGLNTVLRRSSWNPKWNMLGAGSVVVATITSGGGVTDTVSLTKLNDQSLFVLSEAVAVIGSTVWARRRVGALLVLTPPVIQVPAALTVRASTGLSGASSIIGTDSTHGGWNCATGGAPVAGLAVGDTALINATGCAGFSCVSGAPRVLQTPAASDTNTHFVYGHLTWNDIAAMSSAVVPGGALMNGNRESYAANGSCNTADPRNWGDPYKSAAPPAGACESYFPIIHAQGDLNLAGGYGQGILLVEGNLNVTGGFEFFGPVIVRGSLTGSAQGGRFNGAVMAANVSLGASMVHYSSCIMGKALMAAATPSMAKGRSWVEVHN